VCKDITRWRDVFKNGTVDSRMDSFDEMFGRIEDAETEAEMFRAILNGSWPNAQAILEEKLAKIKVKNASSISVS
jgi:phage shock protein A